MPEIKNSRQLSSVYNPRRRKKVAPGFNWYYLHVTALNTAWIIQSIHAKGYVLGDIKLENILVNDRAMTAVIDTDSFQVRDSQSNKVYRCTVGSEGFTPPELLGEDFDTIIQTEIHDRFRLGVLIHYLLFGYHPFSGSWTSVGESPEQTELIKQGYWYGGFNSPIRESRTTIPLNVVHPELKKLFLRCFNDGHTKLNLRPTASDWHNALEVAVNQLISCSRVDSHHYSKHYGKCYWCDRANNLGVDIFPDVANSAKTLSQMKQISCPPKVPDKYCKEAVVKNNNSQNSKKSLVLTNNNQPQKKKSKNKSGQNLQTSKVKSASSNKQKSKKRTSNNIYFIVVILKIAFLFVRGTYEKRVSYLQKKAEDYIDRGIVHYDSSEYQEAIYNFTEAIHLAPNNDDSYFNRGRTYYELNEYRKAIDDYTQVIDFEPNNDDAYFNRGNSYYSLGEYEKAIDDYSQVIELNSKNIGAYTNRALAYYNLSKYRKAIDDYSQAIYLDAGNSTSYSRRANIYYYLKEYRKAVDDYSQVIQLKPNYENAYHNRGKCYYYLSEYKKAIDDYIEAVSINPEHDIAYNDLGLAFVKLGNRKGAIFSFRQAANLGNEDAKKNLSYY